MDNADFVDHRIGGPRPRARPHHRPQQGLHHGPHASRFPLVRIGFPVHDRVGGARILHVGYRGALQLFDRIANTLIERQAG